MSQILSDINTIDKDDLEKWKKIKHQKLIDVKDDCGDLVLTFDKTEVTITCQESDAYGIGVFYSFEKKKKTKPPKTS